MILELQNKEFKFNTKYFKDMYRFFNHISLPYIIFMSVECLSICRERSYTHIPFHT